MDLPLSSSMILVVAVALWLFWVAPYLLRNRAPRLTGQTAGAASQALSTADSTAPTSEGVLMMKASQSQESHMTPSTAPKASTSSAEVRPVFKVRYGRTGIALVALAGLLTAVVAGVLAAFAWAPLWLPVTAAVVTVLSFVSLRRLAVRDHRAKAAAWAAARRAAERAAARPVVKAPESAPAPRKEAEHKETSTPSAPQREEKVFDAEASAPKRTALTAVELRQAALAVAAEAGDVVPAANEPAPVEETWEPVQVPKPTYVDAAKAERPAPKPLEMPEAPKPTAKTSIKQTAPAKAAAPAKAKPETTAAKPAAATKSNSALNNLDDVLQRRRA